jgi:hypothetical protein
MYTQMFGYSGVRAHTRKHFSVWVCISLYMYMRFLGCIPTHPITWVFGQLCGLENV